MILLPEMPVQEPAEVSRQRSAGFLCQLGQALMVPEAEGHTDTFFVQLAVFHENTSFPIRNYNIHENVQAVNGRT